MRVLELPQDTVLHCGAIASTLQRLHEIPLAADVLRALGDVSLGSRQTLV
jgi:hypothetical protein